MAVLGILCLNKRKSQARSESSLMYLTDLSCLSADQHQPIDSHCKQIARLGVFGVN